jgi:hypothetical protein
MSMIKRSIVAVALGDSAKTLTSWATTGGC